jgi:hypothetical protein
MLSASVCKLDNGRYQAARRLLKPPDEILFPDCLTEVIDEIAAEQTALRIHDKHRRLKNEDPKDNAARRRVGVAGTDGDGL